MLQSGSTADIPGLAVQIIFGLNKLKSAGDPEFVKKIFPILNLTTILIQQIREGDIAGARVTNEKIRVLLAGLGGGKFSNQFLKNNIYFK